MRSNRGCKPRRDETKPTLETEKLRRDAVRRRYCTSFTPKGFASCRAQARSTLPPPPLAPPTAAIDVYVRGVEGLGKTGRETNGAFVHHRSSRRWSRFMGVFGGRSCGKRARKRRTYHDTLFRFQRRVVIMLRGGHGHCITSFRQSRLSFVFAQVVACVLGVAVVTERPRMHNELARGPETGGHRTIGKGDGGCWKFVRCLSEVLNGYCR